jgi:hypothetical protein
VFSGRRIKFADNTEWDQYTLYVNDLPEEDLLMKIRIYALLNDGALERSEWFEIHDQSVQFELGTVKTDWSPCGSDVSGDHIISAINLSNERIQISSDKVSVKGFVTIDDLKGNSTTINGSNITTGIVKSSDYSYTSGNYADSGMGIDLDNNLLRSEQFAINEDGRAYFGGTLNAPRGDIGGWKVTDNAIYNNVNQRGVGLISRAPGSSGLLYTIGIVYPDRAYVKGIGSCTDRDVVISDNYDGAKVDQILNDAFYH